jgi:hypothetical protein
VLLLHIAGKIEMLFPQISQKERDKLAVELKLDLKIA